MTRLNPFEFRAGLKHLDTVIPNEPTGLNPFEFRAGLKQFAEEIERKVLS